MKDWFSFILGLGLICLGVLGIWGLFVAPNALGYSPWLAGIGISVSIIMGLGGVDLGLHGSRKAPEEKT